MKYSYQDELEEENQTLRKQLWFVEKGIPKSKDRHTLYDAVVEHLLTSKTLRDFCRQLSEDQSTVNLRDVKVHLSYSKPSVNRYIWVKNAEGSYTRKDIFEPEDPYPHLRKRKLRKITDHSTGNQVILVDD